MQTLVTFSRHDVASGMETLAEQPPLEIKATRVACTARTPQSQLELPDITEVGLHRRLEPADTDTGWNAGLTVDHVADQEDPDTTANEIIGNHTDGTVCGKCHGLGSGGPGTYTWATHHENSQIMMNGPEPTTGAQYNDTTGGCADACHASSYTLATSSIFGVQFSDIAETDSFLISQLVEKVLKEK